MKNEAREDLLPFTRKKQFWFLIKDNPSLLFFANFTAAMFFIPLAFVATWLLISISTIVNSGSASALDCFYSVFYPSLCFIPATMVAGIGMAGLYGIINDLVLRDVSRYSTFWASIKKNWLQFLIYHFFLGLFLSLSISNVGIYLFVDLDPIFKLVLMVISIVLFTLFMFIKPFVLFQITLFSNSLVQIIKNSIAFSTKRFGHNLLCFVLGIIMYVLVMFLPGDLLRVAPVVIIATIWLMFTALLNYIVCIDTLETTLPREQTAEFYRKGLEED